MLRFVYLLIMLLSLSYPSFAANWNNSSNYPNIDISAIKDEIRADNSGIHGVPEIHSRTSAASKSPIRVSNFAIHGSQSLHFMLHDGECGEEDCDTQRERVELIFDEHSSHREYWYRFSFYLPTNFNPVFPASLSLVQFRAKYENGDDTSVVFFKHSAAGLIFQRNGEIFPNTDYQLKNHSELLGKWTEIIFNTNWHDDPSKGFFKIWVDGHIEAYGKLRMFRKNHRGTLRQRMGLYTSWLGRYYAVKNTETAPTREVYLDGIGATTSCEKLIGNKIECSRLIEQNLSSNRIYLGQKTDTQLQIKNFKAQPFNKELEQLNIWPSIRKLSQ